MCYYKKGSQGASMQFSQGFLLYGPERERMLFLRRKFALLRVLRLVRSLLDETGGIIRV